MVAKLAVPNDNSCCFVEVSNEIAGSVVLFPGEYEYTNNSTLNNFQQFF